jgi:hypothetical protein
VNIIDTTIILDRTNIAESPNPKPLTTERVSVRMNHTEEHAGEVGYGFIRNTKLHPEALVRR